MNNIQPTPKYNPWNEGEFRDEVRREMARKQDVAAAPILTSPNGSRFKVTVDNDGTISAVPL